MDVLLCRLADKFSLLANKNARFGGKSRPFSDCVDFV
jgi:hypothetical protein